MRKGLLLRNMDCLKRLDLKCENGNAKRPVKGLSEYMLDTIQKEMVGYNNTVSPPYFHKTKGVVPRCNLSYFARDRATGSVEKHETADSSICNVFQK